MGAFPKNVNHPNAQLSKKPVVPKGSMILPLHFGVPISSSL